MFCYIYFCMYISDALSPFKTFVIVCSYIVRLPHCQMLGNDMGLQTSKVLLYIQHGPFTKKSPFIVFSDCHLLQYISSIFFVHWLYFYYQASRLTCFTFSKKEAISHKKDHFPKRGPFILFCDYRLLLVVSLYISRAFICINRP